MNFLLASVSLFAAVALQARLPAMLGLRLEFVPALVAYGVFTFRRGPALLLAVVAGCLQDALSAAPFGLTGLAYGIVAVILSGMREALDRDLPWVQMGVGAVMSTGASFAALCILGFSISAILKLLLLAALSAVITPGVSLIADYCQLVTSS
jgi:rod shape-determining protein MreD